MATHARSREVGKPARFFVSSCFRGTHSRGRQKSNVTDTFINRGATTFDTASQEADE